MVSEQRVVILFQVVRGDGRGRVYGMTPVICSASREWQAGCRSACIDRLVASEIRNQRCFAYAV